MSDKTREEFEYWASDDGENPAAVERSGNGYKLAQIQTYWQAWLAAKEKYEPEWRPIETAPKEIEFRCLLANKFSMVTAYWDGEGWVNERSPSRSYFNASVWMPLPSAPSTQGGGE